MRPILEVMLHTFCLKKTNKPFIGQARMIVEIEGKMLKNFKKFSTLVFFLVAVCSSFTFAMESNSSADIGGGNPQRKRSVSNAGLATATRDQIVKDALLHQFGEHHYAIATSEYRENLANRELYAATLAVEYEDGEKAGMEKGEKKAKREAIVGMRAISLNDTLICQALQITEQQLQELITEEEI